MINPIQTTRIRGGFSFETGTVYWDSSRDKNRVQPGPSRTDLGGDQTGQDWFGLVGNGRDWPGLVGTGQVATGR